MASKETAAFVRDVTRIVADEAARQVLLRVADDFLVRYDALVARHHEGAVAACCALFDNPQDRCAATTKNGSRCTRKAVLSGHCTVHIATWQRQQQSRDRVQAYVSKQAAEDVYVEDLRAKSKKRCVAMTLDLAEVKQKILRL